MRHPALLPTDIPVVLQLALTPGVTYEALGRSTGQDIAKVHRAVQRLEQARLVLSGERRVALKGLLEFALHGLRFVFFPVLGPDALGVPTAHSAPPLADVIISDTALVWASVDGSVRGQSLQPLYEAATLLPEKNPALYRALALVDALRVGTARERAIAAESLQTLLNSGRHDGQ
jgi:hypothetical protein